MTDNDIDALIEVLNAEIDESEMFDAELNESRARPILATALEKARQGGWLSWAEQEPPKNTTPFIGCLPHYPRSGKPAYWLCWWQNERWEFVGSWADEKFTDDGHLPTHWRPMYAPPTP